MKRAWIAAHLSKWISEAALPLVSLFFFDRNVESRLCPQEIGSFSHLATGFVWGRMAAWLGGSVKGSSRPVKLSDWRILEQGLSWCPVHLSLVPDIDLQFVSVLHRRWKWLFLCAATNLGLCLWSSYIFTSTYGCMLMLKVISSRKYH